MFKNGNDVANDCDAEVHHDVFTEVHQHVLVNSAVTLLQPLFKQGSFLLQGCSDYSTYKTIEQAHKSYSIHQQILQHIGY